VSCGAAQMDEAEDPLWHHGTAASQLIHWTDMTWIPS